MRALSARGGAAIAAPSLDETRLFGGRRVATALIAAMVVEAIGYGMVAPTLPFMARLAGAAEGRIGFLVGVYAAVGLVAAVPLAALSARYGRRTIVLLGLLCLSGASLGFVAAPGYGWLVAARVLQGLGASGVWVGCLTLAADLSPGEHMGRSLSWLTGAWSLGFIAGPALGGLGTLRVPFLLYAGLAAAAFVLGAFGLPVVATSGPPATVHAVLSMLRRPAILASGVATFGVAFFYGTIEAFVPLIVASASTGRAAIGLFFSVAGLPSVILPGVAGRLADRHGDAPLIVIGLLFAAALAASFLLLFPVVPRLLLFLLLGCVEVLVYVPAVALLHRFVTNDERPFASGSHSYAFSAGFFLGPLATGVLFRWGGYATLFGALAATMIAAAAGVTLSMRRAGRALPAAT